jgi:hypothetical protein
VHTCNPALRRPRQEDHEFKATLGYIMKLCLRGEKKDNPDDYGLDDFSNLTPQGPEMGGQKFTAALNPTFCPPGP